MRQCTIIQFYIERIENMDKEEQTGSRIHCAQSFGICQNNFTSCYRIVFIFENGICNLWHHRYCRFEKSE